MPRTSHHDSNIQLQIHEGKGFPQILHGINQDEDQRSISLKPGHEYVIKLYPYGQVSTKDVQKMSLDKRECRLSHETLEGASHPIYTKDSCLFDCHVEIAFKACKCVPWDFAHGFKDSKECDVFGRSCFFNHIENLTHMNEKPCDHCTEECDWIRYRRTATYESLSLVEDNDYCNKYMCIDAKLK